MFFDRAEPARLRLFLLRHGHLENSEAGAINGQTDVGLSPRGERQMASRAEGLRRVPLSGLYSSDLLRTRQSLAPFAAMRPELLPVALSGFRERSFGDWEGKTREMIARMDPQGYARWQRIDPAFAPPGGESLLAFRSRILESLSGLLADGFGQNLLLAAHSGVNRMILLDALGMELSGYFRLTQDYGALNIIDYTSGGDPTVLLMNAPPDASETDAS